MREGARKEESEGPCAHLGRAGDSRITRSASNRLVLPHHLYLRQGMVSANKTDWMSHGGAPPQADALRLWRA